MKIRNWAAVAAKFRGSAGPMKSRNEKRDKEPIDWLLVDEDDFGLVMDLEERKGEENEEQQEEVQGDGGGWGDGSDSVG